MDISLVFNFKYWILIFCVDYCICTDPVIVPGGYKTKEQCEQAIIEARLTEEDNPHCVPSKFPPSREAEYANH